MIDLHQCLDADHFSARRSEVEALLAGQDRQLDRFLRAIMHHERQDGSGYPRGLCGDQIPIQARILAIADIYDALTSVDRPYHPGLPENEALDFLRSEAEIGRIDKDLVEVFIESAAYRSSRP